MQDKIQSISYDTTRIEPVRNYTKEERKVIIEAIEKESEKRMEALAEKREYLAKYPTPKGVPFSEILDQAMGKSKKIPSADDDEGYVLRLSGQARQ